MIKRFTAFFLAIIFVLSFSACQQKNEIKTTSDKPYYEFTDDLNNQVIIRESPKKVISLLGSYSEMWLQAGGKLIGVTEDAVSERNLQLSKDISVIGSVKDPNAELILSMKPDFVLLSTDIKSHVGLNDTLNKANVPHAYFKEDDVADYLRIFSIFTDITNHKDLFDKYGKAVTECISAVKSRIPADLEKPKVLLIRSMSTKAKALKDDHMVGIMLNDLQAENIAMKSESLLEDLSMEIIMAENPDIILVVTMGDTKKAIATLENGIMKNPAWDSLSAVKKGNYHILPKDLFQYKPNARWGESYEYLEKILYP